MSLLIGSCLLLPVGSMRVLDLLDCARDGRARIGHAHVGWTVLLDLPLRIAQHPAAISMDSRLYVPHLLSILSSSRFSLTTALSDSNTIGLIAGVASVDWGCAVQVMAAASIGTDLTFAPTTRQTLFVPSALCP